MKHVKVREYEVKVSVDDLNAVELKLSNLGAELVGYREEQDYYIDITPCTGSMPFDSALRVRIAKDVINNTVRAELTFKGPRERHEFAKIRPEITVAIDDAEKMLEIFKALGFKTLAVISKKRKVYRYGNCRINLDEVDGLGNFIEIEYLIDKEQNVDLLGDVLKVLEKLEIPKNFVKKSYLELILAKSRQ